jgi:CubicO group peptidase (beta-lactamase class C family)
MVPRRNPGQIAPSEPCPELRFRAGSVTRSFVAAVVLQLVAEGRLARSDTLERRLLGTLPYDHQVTICQLLYNHTSGVPTNAAPVERLFGPLGLRGSRRPVGNAGGIPGFLNVASAPRTAAGSSAS